MKWFLLSLVTDSRGRSDEMAILSILGVVTFIGLEVFSVVVGHHVFEPDRFGIGLGSAIAAASIGMGLKSRFGE